MTENEPDTIRYHYEFRMRGIRKEFELHLDRETLALRQEPRATYPEWTALSCDQCPNCPLKEKEHPQCPIAANIVDLVDEFSDILSHDEVEMQITTQERSYTKTTVTSVALSSLLGIYMVTSGCPVMDKLRPLTRFHLPAGTLEETRFRTIAMYLTAQYFVHRRGGTPDWDLEMLPEIYREVGEVNRSFTQRLRGAVAADANLNALVHLDSIASTITLELDVDHLDELETLFAPYLQDV